MKLFRVARVRALALRAHGGVYGHQAHLQKLAQTSAKAKQTRIKNGTVPVKKTRFAAIPFPGFSLPDVLPLMILNFADSYDHEDYDEYTYEDYEEY